MSKRMLIDDTHEEETRVVVINGNKIEDVEFESSNRKQIKSNVYLAKVMRIEPSLQAAFVDYGGNRHGFLAFGEIHPDYYNVSEKDMAELEKEVDAIIENKKQQIKDREEQRARIREEKAVKRAQKLEQEALEQAANNAKIENSEAAASDETAEKIEEVEATAETKDEEPKSDRKYKRKSRKNSYSKKDAKVIVPEKIATEEVKPSEEKQTEEKSEETISKEEKKSTRTQRGRRTSKKTSEEVKVLAANSENAEEKVTEEVDETCISDECIEIKNDDLSPEAVELDTDDEDEDETEYDFEVQRKLILMRKLFHHSKIQDVVKEGQILLVQIVKEERGNKGAALTTYLSLAGRYCVLMPNRIKSGGVSRKITNVQDRKRLKGIIKELPISNEMSLIVRTAGEEKTKIDINRDYNYLMRTWNEIRMSSLVSKAPCLIYEEGNLIKRALRDMFTKEITEIIVDGDSAYKAAKNFMRILSPHTMKKLKPCKPNETPLFQRFQIESQLDKLHDTNVQLESGGYLVINPTEALVSIDVNSGRATKEKDLEETALKTNLEAADEIAKQLRMRNLAGLVVIDFIDMEDAKNNVAIEKRMKEAMKKDRARVQIGKMSCFGLMEISRQRLHSSFFESNYQTCPYCHGRGIVRTIESGAVAILRAIEEEGSKGRSSKINISVPNDVAIYLLNQKRNALCDLEQKYNIQIIISADSSIKNVTEYKIERTKAQKIVEETKENVVAPYSSDYIEDEAVEENAEETIEEDKDNSDRNGNRYNRNGRRDRRYRHDRRRGRGNNGNNGNGASNENYDNQKERQSAQNNKPSTKDATTSESKDKRKVSWWKKLIS